MLSTLSKCFCRIGEEKNSTREIKTIFNGFGIPNGIYFKKCVVSDVRRLCSNSGQYKITRVHEPI